MNHPYIDWLRELKRTKDHILSDTMAKRAFEVLLKKGCDETLILQNLFQYCGADAQEIQSIRKEFKWWSERVPKLSQEILDVADGIESVTSFFADLGIETNFNPDTGRLRLYAQYLQRLGGTMMKGLAGNRESGRDQALAFLHAVIVKTTGRPHHKELATLSDAVATGYGHKVTGKRTADDIGKLIKRIKLLDLAGELAEIPDVRKNKKNRTRKTYA